MIPAHAVYSTAWRRRCRAQIQVRRTGRVTAERRPKQHLPYRHRAASDVSAHKVRVHLFKRSGRHTAPRQHAVAEPRSKPLDLRVNSAFHLGAPGHVEPRSIRNVTIRPQHMLARRRARSIEKRRLCNQHERPLRFPAMCDGVLCLCDFFEGSAQVHCNRSPALRCAPRNRLRKRVIDLERARPMLEPLECSPISRCKPVAGNRSQLSRRGVEKHERKTLLQLAERFRVNSARRVYRSAKRNQLANKCVRNAVRAAAWNRPPHRMEGCSKNQSYCRR